MNDQIFISQTIIDLNLILDKFQLRNKKYFLSEPDWKIIRISIIESPFH